MESLDRPLFSHKAARPREVALCHGGLVHGSEGCLVGSVARCKKKDSSE